MTLTPTVLFDARIYLETVDLTGFGNKVELASTALDEDKTTFASGGWKERAGGLFDTVAGLEGFFDSGDLSKPDDGFWATLGGNQNALTVVPTSGAVGSLAYLTRAQVKDYKPGANVGKLLSWSANLGGNSPMVRGQILHPQGTARTTSGNGTGVQLGAVSATQRLWSTLHVFSVSGTTPSITVKVQSSVDNSWASPTDRITFAADTTLDGQVGSVLGAVTDTWWRTTWAVSGTTPSFLFAVAAGIGPK